MLSVQNLVIALSLCLLAWYIAGIFLNRRRARVLIAIIREGLKGLGEKPSIEWYGRSAFRMELGAPRAPLTAMQVLCLLEPREFAFAWIWGRLRGRRDQVQLAASFVRAPGHTDVEKSGTNGIPGLQAITVKASQPHALLSLQIGAGMEESISRACALLPEFSSGK